MKLPSKKKTTKAFIKPDWPVPDNVRSIITTVDAPNVTSKNNDVYGAFNLGDHVGDDAKLVQANRSQLLEYAQLPLMPDWQTQVHGTQVQILGKTHFAEADACYTNNVDQVCAIMTADCLPILLTSKEGQEIAAVHAGWRGLLAGVIENTVAHFQSKDIIAYLGPAISQQHYQVGVDVYQAFIDHDLHAKKAFLNDGDKYKMNIVALAKQRLKLTNIHQIFGGHFCTYTDSRFYSYRQACHKADGRTGRMASLIWRTN